MSGKRYRPEDISRWENEQQRIEFLSLLRCFCFTAPFAGDRSAWRLAKWVQSNFYFSETVVKLHWPSGHGMTDST